MAWTTPKDWATGDLLTADLMNEQIRDNMLALSRVTYHEVVSDADYSSNTAGFVEMDATNLTLTADTTGGLCFIGMSTNVQALYTTNNTIRIQYDISIDGTMQHGQMGGLASSVPMRAVNNGIAIPEGVNVLYPVNGLAAGTHTFRLFWGQSHTGVTIYTYGTASGGTPTRLFLMEVSV